MSSSQQASLPWAAVAVDVTADFTGPTPVYSARVVDGGTKAARLLGTLQPTAINFLMNFAIPALPRDKRNVVIGIEAPYAPIEPFEPVYATMQPQSDTDLTLAIVAGAPPPPQFSPPRTIRLYAAVGIVTSGP
jgi:hypothetical protein